MGLSCLTDSAAVIVIDASTAINVNATGCAAQILRALPNRIAITEVVMAELAEDRRSGRRDSELIAKLQQTGLIAVVPLSESQERHFESLVIGRGVDTLDDGEAATIAYAVETGATALIDERKANRICGERYPTIRVGCTIDLLAHASVKTSLGDSGLADAVFAALLQARMRVLPHHMDWVVRLIGEERARQCPSLPRAVRILADRDSRLNV
jgi:predicted nucleic acid-binding protein